MIQVHIASYALFLLKVDYYGMFFDKIQLFLCCFWGSKWFQDKYVIFHASNTSKQ